MKKWSNFWPFLGAVLLLTVGNGDWVLAPLALFLIDSFGIQFFILAVLFNIELIGWYKFWRWFFVSFLPQRRKIKETINFTKEVAQELKARGYVDKFVEHFENTFEWAVHPDCWLFRVIKAGGHAGMLFLGFEPFVTGGRMAGVLFCVTTGWKNGLYSLMLGNCVHVLIVLGSWNLILYLWDKYRDPLILLVVTSAIFMASRYVWKRLKHSQHLSKSP